jgi:hypothetical protein
LRSFSLQILSQCYRFEKLQSSKIFVVSNSQIEGKAAEQRNINEHSTIDSIQNFIGQ